VLKLMGLFVIGMVLSLVPAEVAAQQAAGAEGSSSAPAQQNQPPAAQRAEDQVEGAVRRFRIGVQGGVGLDPESLDVGVHAAFGPVFTPNVEFRPVFEVGLGEITTLLGINLDVLYMFPGADRGDRETRWTPYVGGGPHFGLSHQSFTTDDVDNVDNHNDDDRSRFDFSDTDFDGGMNFIVGMRKQSGTFFEMKATAWGVSNIRLLVGFNF
jgi:hypothetical protein